jgi:hypothetical protein
MLDDIDDHIIITNIIFGDSHVEIGYMEKRLQAERAGVVSTLLLDRLLASEAIDELLELAADVVDKGLLEIRKPDTSLDPRKRLARRAESVPDDE